MNNEIEIEANKPAEAVDPIEAIKDKILNAVREVPLITNQVGWSLLVNSGIISLDEMIVFTNHLSKPTSPPQLTGATAGGSTGGTYYPATQIICLATEFPDSLGAKHPDGTIHASTIISNSDEEEREQLKLWFQGSLVGENILNLKSHHPMAAKP